MIAIFVTTKDSSNLFPLRYKGGPKKYMRRPKCPQCDFEPLELQSEEIAVSSSSGEIHGIQRNFDGACPTHGPFWDGPIGNHSTLLESQLMKMFPKPTLKILSARLPVDERKAFRKALEGKLFAEPARIDSWQVLAMTLAAKPHRRK
jgi:hypothetical protein